MNTTHCAISEFLLFKQYVADCSRNVTTSTRPSRQANIKGVSPLCESRRLWSCFGWNNNTSRTITVTKPAFTSTGVKQLSELQRSTR